MFTLHQSYATAVVIDSNQLRIETGSTEFDILTKAISLLPFVGSHLSEGINSIKDFVMSAQVAKAASEVCSFATLQTDFDAIVQDALCQVLLEQETKLKLESLDDSYLNDSLLPSWVGRFPYIDAIRKLNNQVDLYLYGKRNKTPLQKFGYQAANTLVSDHIASGEIYQGALAVRIPQSEKRARLIKVARLVINQRFKENPRKQESLNKQGSPNEPVSFNKEESPKRQESLSKPESSNKETPTELFDDKNRASCSHCSQCQVFSVSKIIYDNPLLNDIKAFKKLSSRLGAKRALETNDLLNKQIRQDKFSAKALSSSDYLLLLNLLLGEEKFDCGNLE